jgi:hypothetical protein
MNPANEGNLEINDTGYINMHCSAHAINRQAALSRKMLLNVLSLALLSLGTNAAVLKPRLDDGVANTPPMGSVLSLLNQHYHN